MPAFIRRSNRDKSLRLGLVALQAHCPPRDRAVATSTRNLFRMLGSVIGMTIASALQSAVTQAALPDNIPASVLSQVTMGTWKFGTTAWDQDISYAKFKGFQSVFAMEIPFMALCFLGCFGIPSATFGDDDQTAERGNT
jgi:hypothetical protein